MSSTSVLRSVLSQPSGAIGLTLVVGHVMLALLSPILLPHDPLAQSTDLILQAPSLSQPFGTDRLGRDMFSRIVMGTRISLTVGLIGITISFTLGMFWAVLQAITAAGSTAC